MTWRAQLNDKGIIYRYKDLETGEVISVKEYQSRIQHENGNSPAMYNNSSNSSSHGYATAPISNSSNYASNYSTPATSPSQPVSSQTPSQPGMPTSPAGANPQQPSINTVMLTPNTSLANPNNLTPDTNPLIQPGAIILNASNQIPTTAPGSRYFSQPAGVIPREAHPPTEGMLVQPKNLRLEGNPNHMLDGSGVHKAHGFLDATSIAILLPTLVLLALILAAAHKKRLFPWQTVRTFNPPSGLMMPKEYEKTYLCPPNLRRHGRMGKRNPEATWTDADGAVIPFGFLARTNCPVTIPLGRLPNKNMFIVAPSGSGKTTLMRAIIKALLAKPSVIIALEAKANDPNLDENKEGFKYTILPEAVQAGFNALYFNPLDEETVHWNPLDIDPVVFATSIVQDVNSMEPEAQHWAERDLGYIRCLAQVLRWGALQCSGEDENGSPTDFQPLPCNPRGLMKLVYNRRNIIESLKKLKVNQEIDQAELSEVTQVLAGLIRTEAEWDKNIQGLRGRLRMFRNANVLRATDKSDIDLKAIMHKPTVLIFGAPASIGPDAESLSACFVYQLQQALHTRYGTKSVLPLYAFFDEYQTLNLDTAGRLSAIVRGANGGLAVILQNISQIAGGSLSSGAGMAELKTIFSNSAIRICMHNADDTTAKFFSDEIGKHSVVIPGLVDRYEASGFNIFPNSWNRVHSQQVVPRVDQDSIKRMEKHHALVYLSPASDPEFGEIKPFMVNLGGIEEIARVHFMHNVIAKAQNSQIKQDQASPEDKVVNQVQAEMINLAKEGMANSLNQANNNVNGAVCDACGKNPGKGKFCIECGAKTPNAINLQAINAEAEKLVQAKIINQNNADIALPMDNSVKKPVTSLDPDLSKLGLPGQHSASALANSMAAKIARKVIN